MVNNRGIRMSGCTKPMAMNVIIANKYKENGGIVHTNAAVERILLQGKKAKGLLLPWFIFSLLNIIASQILSFNKQGSLVSELSWNFLQIRGKGDEIWFLPALFLAFIPFYFFVDWYKKSKLSIA